MQRWISVIAKGPKFIVEVVDYCAKNNLCNSNPESVSILRFAPQNVIKRWFWALCIEFRKRRSEQRRRRDKRSQINRLCISRIPQSKCCMWIILYMIYSGN